MRRTLAACALLVLASSGIALASENRGLELGLGSVDGTDSSGNGTAYALAWREPLGKTGRWSGRFRMDYTADLGDVDAFSGTGELLSTFGLGKRGQGYVGGGLGAVWQEAIEQAVTVRTAGKWGDDGGSGEPRAATTVTVETSEHSNFLEWTAVAGGRWYFSPERTTGIGLEGRYGHPMTDVPADDTLEAFGYFIFPVGTY